MSAIETALRFAIALRIASHSYSCWNRRFTVESQDIANMRRAVQQLIVCASIVLCEQGASLQGSEPEFPFVQRRCGVLSLQVVLEMNGTKCDADELERLVAGDGDMSTLHELSRTAQHCGMSTIGLEWPSGLPADLAVPAIIRVVNRSGEPHFVVLTQVVDDQVQIIDYPNDPQWVTKQELGDAQWNKVSLHIDKDPQRIRMLSWEFNGSKKAWRYLGMGTALAVLVGLLSRRVLRRRAIWPQR